MARWLAVDYGTRRIGLALCDAEERLATPAGTLPAAGSMEPDAAAIVAAAREHAADGVVIGLPLNMDGSDGPQAKLHRRLAAAITARAADTQAAPAPAPPGTAPLLVELFDERLTSYQADDWMRQSGLTHKQKKSRRDALAATALLQGFLEARADGPDA